MSYQELFRALHAAPAPLAVLAHLLSTSRPGNKALAGAALAHLTRALQSHQTGRSLTAARVLLLAVGPDKALERMRRAGLLRNSTFGYHAPALERLIADWRDQAALYGVAPGDSAYLASAQALAGMAPALRAVQRRITAQLRLERLVVVKTLLAELDAAFAEPESIYSGLSGEAGEPTATREELAEAFSYLLGQAHAQFGVGADQFALLDIRPEQREACNRLLTDALAVCRFREAEALIEGFPYRAEFVSGRVRVQAGDPALEQALRVGYLQHEMQANAERVRLQHVLEQRIVGSLDQVADRYAAQLGARACRLVERPLPRYVVEMPLSGPVADLLRSDSLFAEEVSSLSALAWEEFVEPDTVGLRTVSGSITVFDLVKVQRLFRFMHRVLRQALRRELFSYRRDALYRASCLPVLTRAQLDTVLEMAVGPAKVGEVRRMLQADLNSPSLDIQYAPLIGAGGMVMLSPAVLASSNLARNILCRLHARLAPPAPGQADVMQTALANALRGAGFLVAENLDMGTRKQPLEVDILAYRDGCLFPFECKYTYHPCNVYELRNTYDAMLGAAGQLTLRRDWLVDPAHQRALLSRLGWPQVDLPAPVLTCIALGNRVFTGYTCHGHPVRQVYEMLNVLERGHLEVAIDERRSIWQGASFHVDDLMAYLAGSTTLADMTAALLPVEVVTPIGNLALVRPTFALDALAMRETVLGRYPAMEDVDR